MNTTLRDAVSRGPAGKSHWEWRDVGFAHNCRQCAGVTTVVNGKTIDTMGHACGSHLASCCALPAAPKNT